MKAKLFVILGLIALPMAATIAMSNHRAMQKETTGQYVDISRPCDKRSCYFSHEL